LIFRQSSNNIAQAAGLCYRVTFKTQVNYFHIAKILSVKV
jgi:hypothetical protein